MNSTLTLRIDSDTARLLDEVSKKTGSPKSKIVRDALRKQLLIDSFQNLRKKGLHLAEAQGLLTDEDIFNDIS